MSAKQRDDTLEENDITERSTPSEKPLSKLVRTKEAIVPRNDRMIDVVAHVACLASLDISLARAKRLFLMQDELLVVAYLEDASVGRPSHFKAGEKELKFV